VSATDNSSVQTYYLYDGLGSTTDLTDDEGTVTGTYEYDVFGSVRAHSGADTEWTYTGEQNDPTGLEYLRARYYDAATGRFLSRDPWWVRALVSQSSNRYVYVLNNPANCADPHGLECDPLHPHECVGDFAGWVWDQLTDPENTASAKQTLGGTLAGVSCPLGETGIGAAGCTVGTSLYVAATAEKMSAICEKQRSGEYTVEEADARIIVAIAPAPRGVAGFIAKKLAKPIIRKVNPGMDICSKMLDEAEGEGRE
jgi:RHS repeat-associated protein